MPATARHELIPTRQPVAVAIRRPGGVELLIDPRLSKIDGCAAALALLTTEEILALRVVCPTPCVATHCSHDADAAMIACVHDESFAAAMRSKRISRVAS